MAEASKRGATRFDWDEFILTVVIVIVLAVLAALIAHAMLHNATRPTVDEVIGSIPTELMPPGGRPVRSGLFGGPMIDNGGRDYVLVIDEEGKYWQFSRTHEGDDWERKEIWQGHGEPDAIREAGEE